MKVFGTLTDNFAELISTNQGATLTSKAMGEDISWFPYILSAAVILFSYSTIIAGSDYGELCWAYLFGVRSTLAYKALFLTFACLGAIFQAGAVIDFGDMMILGMAFPNLLGVVMLSGVVKRELDRYMQRLAAGQFPRYSD